MARNLLSWANGIEKMASLYNPSYWMSGWGGYNPYAGYDAAQDSMEAAWDRQDDAMNAVWDRINDARDRSYGSLDGGWDDFSSMWGSGGWDDFDDLFGGGGPRPPKPPKPPGAEDDFGDWM